MEKIIEKSLGTLPDIQQLLLIFSILTLYTVLVSNLVIWLKIKKNIRTPYTRKIFHFFIISAATFIQLKEGLAMVYLYGIIVSCVVIYAVIRSNKSLLFLALARNTDAPREKMFVIVPLVTTAVGGVLSNLFFGEAAIIGYLVGGWGDAIGEPVGSKWGKHTYKVSSVGGVKAVRSLEGSIAVALISVVVCFLSCFFLLDLHWYVSLITAACCGLVTALVEAVSTHGFDNLSIQLFASATVWFFCRFYGC